MLNKTSSFYEAPKLVDFTVMGLDKESSDFLNWCLSQRDNLEYVQACRTLEKVSQAFTIHLDHLSSIRRIDDVISHER